MTITRRTRPIAQNDAPTGDDLLTIPEVARILRVDPTTVRRYINQGTLEAIVLPHVGKRAICRIKWKTIDDITTPRRLEA